MSGTLRLINKEGGKFSNNQIIALVSQYKTDEKSTSYNSSFSHGLQSLGFPSKSFTMPLEIQSAIAMFVIMGFTPLALGNTLASAT